VTGDAESRDSLHELSIYNNATLAVTASINKVLIIIIIIINRFV